MRFTTARFSKYTNKNFTFPPPRWAPVEFRRAVTALIKDLNLDLVIPTCEEVFYLADLHPKVLAPPGLLLKQVHSKWEFLESISGCGLPIPTSHLLTQESDLPRDPECYVFKSEFSRFGEGTQIGHYQGVSPSSTHRVVMQERLVGREISGYGVALQGELTAWSNYLPVYRIAGASGVFFRPVDVPAAREFAENFVKKHNYHGQVAFDFIQDESGLYPLECNPRATSGVHLFGQNLASIFDGESAEMKSKDRMLSPALCLVWPTSPFQFAKDILSAKDAIFDPSDPLPVLGMAAHVMETLALSLKRQTSLKHAMTRDLEWDGEEFARV